MKVKTLVWVIWDGSAWPPNSELEIPKDVADKWIAEGQAEAVKSTKK